MAKIDEAEEIAVDDQALDPPKRYAVLLLNDDYTTMEFVIEVLTRFFQKTEAEAFKITLEVHHQGRSVAGIYPFEIAETKADQVVQHARSNGHPLQCTIEPIEYP